jgi:glycosyltransferase involved in cell wall biosynthesis
MKKSISTGRALAPEGGDLRINYTLPGSSLTGGVRTFFEISKRLVKKGHEVTVTLPNKPDATFDWQARVFYPRLSMAKNLAGMALGKFLTDGLGSEYQYLELEKSIPDCDVNFATLCFTTFPVHRSGKGKPFYHMQHFEPLFFDSPRLQRIAEESYYLPFTRIANSSWLKKTVFERTGAESHLVLHGLDHEKFYPRETHVEDHKRRVVAYGNQRTWKGIPDLLEAMEIVNKQHGDTELIIYGSSPITYKRTGAPYTFLKGLSDDALAELYSSADVVACPSWYESFPGPPLEGMACGVPVVTTSIGTEDYAINEETALVVPPRDPKKMAEAILELMKNEELRERLKKAGIKKAKEFTWDRTADAVEKVFRGEVR